MPFERFMELALYDAADGFFGSGPLRSTKSGDFLTSPEVSPWFGQILAEHARATFARVGRPHTLVEVGAGSGSLLRPLLAALDEPPDEVVAIDASPAARAALAELGVTVATSVGDIDGPLRGVIIANELLDNLPMALGARSETGWEERFVGLVDDHLALVPATARPAVLRWLQSFAGTVPAGGIVEVQLEAADWLRSCLNLLETGSMLLIDYGGTAEELAPRRALGTLRTYRAHHLGPDPLLEPGATDITADVNFSALIPVGEQAGATVALHRQDDFLKSLGLSDRINEMRGRELELAKGEDAKARLQVRSELKDAQTLLHPRGLGDFRVLEINKG